MSKKREIKENKNNQKAKGRLAEIVEPLLQWYDGNRRILPWREDPTPYRVWVSEIMLQQTRVEAGRDYFERFVKNLPDIESLANVRDEQLMKLWEGLGYYNRARNLKKAAGIIMEQFSGEMPSTYIELLELPGIGPYTAGAIASIAFGETVPAVDGNVLRVIARIMADYGDITSSLMKKNIETQLTKILPNRTGDFNQALMELGALVCIPNGAPKCSDCPVSHFCIAFQNNLIGELPVKKQKKPRKLEQKTMLILKKGHEMALRKRPRTGLLAGLFELPSLSGFLSESEIALCLSKQGFAYTTIRPLGDAKHIFSHVEWRMQGYEIEITELPNKRTKSKEVFRVEESSVNLDCREELGDLIWVRGEALQEEVAIPSAFKPYAHAFPKAKKGGD
ncbi:MAG: A/G-specific adenine glycosylase [Anaerovorax sp.]|nr:A/G-specific adenine glycosylase [Anaerovorax sp.]